MDQGQPHPQCPQFDLDLGTVDLEYNLTPGERLLLLPDWGRCIQTGGYALSVLKVMDGVLIGRF